MSKRAFWPGFRWRILAHKRTDSGKATPASYITDGQIETASAGFDGPVEFDELVIDDWFHLEQMDDRQWWIGVGNGDDYWHVNVNVDRNGQASVQVEKQ